MVNLPTSQEKRELVCVAVRIPFLAGSQGYLKTFLAHDMGRVDPCIEKNVVIDLVSQFRGEV